jgi:hypothetical protein
MPSFGTRPVGSAVQPCPYLKPKKAPHWIAVKLVRSTGEPVADQEFEISLPGGTAVPGYTNSKGEAIVRGIEQAGECSISFPALDRDVWKPKG